MKIQNLLQVMKLKNIVSCTQIKKQWLRNYCLNSTLKPPWNVMFFGNDTFSLPSLQALCNQYRQGKYIKKLEVVTSVKIEQKQNPVHKFACGDKLNVHKWPISASEIKDFDIGVVVSFGNLIPENIIKSFPLGIINVHASVLPRWRGAAPIVYSLLADDDTTGVTVMRIEPNKFDIGDIVRQKEIKMPKNITQPELNKLLSELGADELIKAVEELPTCLMNAAPQPQHGASYAPRINVFISRINWSTMDSKQIYNLFRALKGLYPLQCFWNGKIVKLLDIAIVPENKSDISRLKSDFNEFTNIAGYAIFNKTDNQLKVQCLDGKWIVAKQLVIQNKKPMSGRDFYNGFLSKCNPRDRIFK